MNTTSHKPATCSYDVDRENGGAGGSYPPTSIQNPKTTAREDEVLDCNDTDISGGDCVIGGVSSSEGVPKPMEGIHEIDPPPFLRKIFEMVEDPETDPIVSWSVTKDSFIVWDTNIFSDNLLPKYFKHKNFSSFIRQLNTYGFRKIDAERWEFANKAFQAGMKHMLKNIKRRAKYSKQQKSLTSIDKREKGTKTLNSEVETLKEEQNILRAEILKLKKQQEDSQLELTAIEERVQWAECMQHHMLTSFTNLIKHPHPSFVQKLIRNLNRQKELLLRRRISKKRRLLEAEAIKNMAESTYPNSRNQTQEQSKYFSVASDNLDETCFPIQDDKEGSMSSFYHVMSENLMADELTVDEVLALNDTNFYPELDDFSDKPQN